MSQNPPETGSEYDQGFLDSDVDLQIGRPPSDGKVVTRSASDLPSIWVLLLGFVVTGGVLAGGYYLGYQRGLEVGQRDLPPVIIADPAPSKVPAAELPEAEQKAADDLNIYGVMQGKDGETPVLEGPADNANGAIESLIAQSETLAEIKQQAEDLPPATVLAKEPGEMPEVAATEPAKTAEVDAAAKPSGRQDYMVQLAATRSRALARGTYSKLQAKHDALLGRRDPLILRIDFGEKGVFYRVNVPGFPHRMAANNFCINLKERGQDCLVKKQP